MTWLLEQETFGYDYYRFHQEMVDAIASAGQRTINHPKLMYGKDLQYPGEYRLHVGDSIIPRGSIDFLRTFQKQIPAAFRGEWVDWSKLTFAYAANLFGREMLSDDFILLPYKELTRRWSQIRKIFGHKVFLRPDSGMKQFAGHTASVDEYELLRNPVNCGDSQLIVVASGRMIPAEYRVLVVDGQVVTSSRYMENHELSISSFVPHGVTEYAANIVRDVVDHFPAAFIIDIADLAKDGYKVIECNGFNCSELYAMDYTAVVRNITGLAQREYLEQTQDFPRLNWNVSHENHHSRITKLY